MQEEKTTKISLSTFRRYLAFFIFTILIFAAGWYLGKEGYKFEAQGISNMNVSREVPSDKNVDFSLFWRVWDTLETRYYDQEKLDPRQMVYGAVKGMVSAVDDPYTVFLPPKENKVVQEDLQGNFEGVGIQIGFKGNQLAVIAPLPDSPAQEVGVRAGDYIVGIKDEKKEIDRGTVGITLQEAVQSIRGESGTKVTLTLLRENEEEPIVKDITRKSITVPSIVVTPLDADGNPIENQDEAEYLHIRIVKFSGEMLAEWDSAVSTILKSKDVKGVIVDVRNNPGGFMQGAIDLASDFLATDSVVVMEETGNKNRQEYTSTAIPRLKDENLVVLVNEGSASASEIFAGAIKDNNRAQIVGQTTFGKGTIQEPQQINGGAGLHITIAKWLTPNGTWVNEGGLEPNIVVEDDPETAEDEQILRAIEALAQ